MLIMNTNRNTNVVIPLNFKIDSLQDVLVNELQDVYSGEKTIVKELPELKELVTSSRLKEAFDDYMELTYEHMRLIDDLFSYLGIEPIEGINPETVGLFVQSKKFFTISDKDIRDAAFITSLQKVAHIRIASWNTLKVFSRALNYADVTNSFQRAIDEVEKIVGVLTEITEDYINRTVE